MLDLFFKCLSATGAETVATTFPGEVAKAILVRSNEDQARCGFRQKPGRGSSALGERLRLER